VLITALAIAIAAGMLYAIIAALERGDSRSARQLLVPLVLAFSLALLLLWRAFQYGFCCCKVVRFAFEGYSKNNLNGS